MKFVGKTYGQLSLGQEILTEVYECEKCKARQTLISEKDKMKCRECGHNEEYLSYLREQLEFESREEAKQIKRERESNKKNG